MPATAQTAWAVCLGATGSIAVAPLIAAVAIAGRLLNDSSTAARSSASYRNGSSMHSDALQIVEAVPRDELRLRPYPNCLY